MIKLDQLFKNRRIPYSVEGKHSTQDHCNIQCPFCGKSDPSFHLGISTINGSYHCWRDPKHAGYNLDYLLSRVLKISRPSAKSLILEYSDSSYVVEKIRDDSKIWSFFDIFDDVMKYEKPMLYLKKRGFDNIDFLCNTYDLKYCHIGDWAGRIIIPIYSDTGDLVSFTARDVTGLSEIRYKTLGSNYSKKEFSDLMFNSNRIKKEKSLVVVEGPFDSMKIEYVTSFIFSWALMGLNLSKGKIETIKKHSDSFKNIYLLIDNDQGKIKSRMMAEEIESYIKTPVKSLFLPEKYKDVGDMDNFSLHNWLIKEVF